MSRFVKLLATTSRAIPVAQIYRQQAPKCVGAMRYFGDHHAPAKDDEVILIIYSIIIYFIIVYPAVLN